MVQGLKIMRFIWVWDRKYFELMENKMAICKEKKSLQFFFVQRGFPRMLVEPSKTHDLKSAPIAAL